MTEEIKNIIDNAELYEDEDKNFSFVPVGEIINNLQPIQWLIKGYFEEHTLALLFGDPASGKSFIAIDQACCIATGTPYHGCEVTQGAVFYIAGEGHNGLGRRFKAWAEYNGVSLDNAPLYIAERPAQLYDEEHAEAVGQAVQGLAEKHGVKPALIVIDTLARNFGGGDENNTQDMNLFVKHIDELKDRWKATALIVHHTGHGDKGRARGSIALKGALDHEYSVTKHDFQITMRNTKTKDSKEPAVMYLDLISVPILLSDNTTVESAALQKITINLDFASNGLTKQQDRALDALKVCLRDNGKERALVSASEKILSVTLEEYRNIVMSKKIINSDKPDSIRRAMDRIIKEFKERGIVGTDEVFIWILDKPDKVDGPND